MEPRMEACLAQVLQKDVGKRLQVGQELIDYFSDKQKSADLEHDQTMLDKLVDGLATSWVNSSNYKVSHAFRRHSSSWLAAAGDQDWVSEKSFMSRQRDSLLSVRHFSHIVAAGLFFLEQVEFSLIFVGDQKILVLQH